MGRYLVRVTRVVVEVIDLEIEAKDENTAEWMAEDDARYTDSGWEERGARYEAESVETIEEDEEPDELGDVPLDDTSRHYY